MTEKKELMNEDILSLVSGGYLKKGYEEQLEKIMEQYERDLTKDEFIFTFKNFWKNGVRDIGGLGPAYVKAVSYDPSDEDLEACLKYIDEHYEYKPRW